MACANPSNGPRLDLLSAFTQPVMQERPRLSTHCAFRKTHQTVRCSPSPPSGTGSSGICIANPGIASISHVQRIVHALETLLCRGEQQMKNESVTGSRMRYGTVSLYAPAPGPIESYRYICGCEYEVGEKKWLSALTCMTLTNRTIPQCSD